MNWQDIVVTIICGLFMYFVLALINVSLDITQWALHYTVLYPIFVYLTYVVIRDKDDLLI